MYIRSLALFIMLLGGLLGPTVQGQQSFDTLARVDSLFRHWGTQTPGGVLLVTRRDQAVYHQAFGMADLEHALANTPETVFESGSVAKQFTTTAIFLLVLDGKLSLDEPVRKYVPELPAFTAPITIRHLIHHTSGLRDWGSLASISGWWRGTRVHTHAHVLEILARQQALNFPAGDQYSYCNSGYNLQAIIIDRVSGMPFAEFCKKRIFEPMGMSKTQWRDDYRKIVPNRAVAYSRNNREGYLQDMPFEQVHGNGGLLTTTADLARWNTHYKNPVVGGKALIDLQMVRGKLNNGVTLSYAGGIVINNYNGFTEISHSGSTAGYRAWLAYYPEQDLSIAFLSNDGNSNPSRVGAQVAEIFLGARKGADQPSSASSPDARSLSAKTGLYFSPRTHDLLELEVIEGALRIKNGPRLNPGGEQTFYQGDQRLDFGDKKLVVFYSNGDSTSFLRKEPFRPSTGELQAFTGTFSSPEAETTYVMDVKDGKLRVFRRPDTYFYLTPLFADTFRSGSGSLVQFRRDKQGKITGLSLSVSRANGVWFGKEERETGRRGD